jgi:hypothetical protein
VKPTTILLRRVGGMLHPADAHAAAALAKIPLKKTVAMRALRVRSPEQLALYWRILERVVDSTGRWRCAEELHLALKVATGRVSTVRLIDGRRVLVPDSIAFDQMSQDEFQAYLQDALRVIERDIDVPPEVLLAA